MLRLLPATAAALFIVGSAAAQDFTPSLAAPQSVYDWSGFYLGTQLGWGWANQHITDNTGLDADLGLNGGYFGPVIGFQKQWNRVVVGAEVEANWSDIDGQDSFAGAVGRTFGGVEIFGSAGIKLGLAFNRFLAYGTAGIAGGERSTSQRNGPANPEDHAASLGWMAGAGVDFAVTERVILGLQYRHYELSEADYNMGFVPDRKGSLSLDTLNGHIVFKLGMP
jgi:outer membrane immunogenic protein